MKEEEDDEDFDVPWWVLTPLAMFAFLPEIGFVHFEFWVVDDCQALGGSRWECWLDYFGTWPGLILFGGGLFGLLAIAGMLLYAYFKVVGKTEMEEEDVST